MNLTVKAYRDEDAEIWDNFCNKALQATFLHSRKFLSYHLDRFIDCSLIVMSDSELVGLFPAAQSPQDSLCVISHPGITYGGILHQGGLRGERMMAALSEIVRQYREQGYARLIYKSVPNFYHRTPAQDDLYALFRLGAVRTRCDLSSTIDLQHRLPTSERRRRGQKKALKAGSEVVEGFLHLPELWTVLMENLARKYGTQPVHLLDEIQLLTSRFPDQIRCVCGRVDGKIEAGLLLFITPTALHAQYIASSDIGYAISLLDLVIEHCIEIAMQEGKRWFDFGISNENQGMYLNEGLYRFKSEFGGGGSVHEFYALELN